MVIRDYKKTLMPKDVNSNITYYIKVRNNHLRTRNRLTIRNINISGTPGWRSGLAPAFRPGRDPGDPGSNPTSGSRCMEPASPSACVSVSVSVSLSLYLMNKQIKIFKII